MKRIRKQDNKAIYQRQKAALAKKPPGSCRASVECPHKADGGTTRCRKHRMHKNVRERAAKKRIIAYRKQLGFCFDCLERVSPGRVRCEKHLASVRKETREWRASKYAKRGWKLMKVQI